MKKYKEDQDNQTNMLRKEIEEERKKCKTLQDQFDIFCCKDDQESNWRVAMTQQLDSLPSILKSVSFILEIFYSETN